MTNIFTITTAQQALKADANGNATTVFTVTNSTSRPLRGIVKVKPLGNTQAQWLKIDGETERDFPAGGTHQFTVNFSKPKPANAPNTAQPAESFPFRLDTISAINPDEDFTEGPIVTVEIPEQKAPEQKKPFPWWILVILGVLLIIGLIVGFLLLRNSGDGDANNNSTPTRTPTVTPTASPTAPATTRVILDFTEKAPTAVWKNDLDRALVLGDPPNPEGFVRVITDASMESGFKEASVLHTHPRWVDGGGITGTYDLPEAIDAKDKFRARIGFLNGGRAGNLRVRLLLNGTVIAEMPKAYDGALREFEVDLSRYQGERGKFALQAVAIPTSAQGWICWIKPRIERAP